MKNKKVILSSILSLVCCLCLIVGGTFAYFTSETKTNIAINAGTVEVFAYIDNVATYTLGELQEDNTFALGGSAAYDEATNTLTLDNIAPGDRVDLNVYIENRSSLAASYRVVVAFEGGLKDALVATLNVADDTTNPVLNADTPTSEWIDFGERTEVILPMSVELPFTTGNDYQGANAAITITVEAIQANAVDKVVIGDTQYDTLDAAMAAAEIGEEIVLGSGTYELDSVVTDGTLAVAEGANVTLVLGDDVTISSTVSSSNDEVKVNAPTITNNGNLTIEGGTIVNKNATAGNTNVPAILNESGTLTLKGCTIENVAPTTGGAYCVVVKGGEVILEDCTVTGNRGAINVSGEGEIHMIGGSVSANVYYTLYISGTGNSTFENVTFTKQNNSKGKAITYNVLNDGEGTVTFTNCTFVSKTASAIPFDIYGNTTGMTFDNCIFTNVTEP